MILAEESSRPEDRRCLRFKCSSFYELNAVNTLPVHDLSAVNDCILRFKYSSTGGLACGCNHEAHPDNMSCFGTILISYEANGRNRYEGRGSSILTSFGENWLFDGWNVNEFK